MFTVPCVYYGYSTRGCIHLQERCNIFQAIGANTSPAAKGSTRRVSGRPALQIIRQAERPATPRPDKKSSIVPSKTKKDSIMLWNTHCEGIIPADMTDMTVDMPFCVFEPTRPSSTVLMSFYIIRLLPVACKLSYAQLARTHASQHAPRVSFVLQLTYVMHSLSFKLKPT